MECLPGSTLPDDLRALGYITISKTGEGERILAGAIVEKLVAGPNSELVPLTEGSTLPVAAVVRHAGDLDQLAAAFSGSA
jgi:hypothetical protein